MTNMTQVLTEQHILNNSLMDQKMMTGVYNTFAGECVNEQLRGAMLSILTDEHKIQADIFSEMQSHGWYQVEPAEVQKIQKAKQKLSSM